MNTQGARFDSGARMDENISPILKRCNEVTNLSFKLPKTKELEELAVSFMNGEDVYAKLDEALDKVAAENPEFKSMLESWRKKFAALEYIVAEDHILVRTVEREK